MTVKRIVTVIALLAIIVTQLVTPKRTYALSSTVTALVIAGAAVGAYVAAVVIATEVHRRSRGPFELMPGAAPDPLRKQDEGGLRFATRCAQRSPALTVMCW